MSRRQELIDLLRNQDAPIQVYQAIVISIDARWNQCTVRLLPSDLEVEGVAMVAEEDAGSWLCVTPKIDSLVLVGCVYNQVSQMYLVQCGEPDSIEILIEKSKVNIDKDRISLVNNNASVTLDQEKTVVSQGNLSIELKGGKVRIKNDQTDLKTLFDDLSTLLQNFKVVTAQGPSTALFPDTLAALTQFKTKYPLLLS